MQYISEIRLRLPLPADAYFADLPPVRQLAAGAALRFDRPVTFLVGENGAGKSTLLEAIAVCCGLNPEGGSRNIRFSTEETHAALGAYLTPVRRAFFQDGFFLRAESLYNVATYLDRLNEDDPRALEPYGGRSLHRQSHGESFLALVQHRFGGRGLYLLDEPEAALSPSRQLTLLCELRRLAEAGAQCIIATHSPILMALPGARLYRLDEAGFTAADYRDTEHYRLTRQFLEDPERMLHYLFREDDHR